MSSINVFLGDFDFVLDELLNFVSIDLVFVENRVSNKKIIDLCRVRGIQYFIVDGFGDLFESTRNLDIDFCFMASFSIILKQCFIDGCNKIINFHMGDIEVCRGRHPLPVAIVNNFDFMGFTVHLVDSERIDFGGIVVKVSIPIDYGESYEFNKNVLFDFVRAVIPSVFRNGFRSCVCDNASSVYYKPLDSVLLERVVKSDCLMEFKK